MTKKHIAIIGSALSGNKGAAAMLESAIQTLGAQYGPSNVEFSLLSMYPREDRAQNPYPNLNIINASPLTLGVGINSLALLYKLLPFARRWIISRSAAIRALSEADVLLDQGGITFVDGREKFLLYNTASILPALMMGVPVVKCAQALGPFNNPINAAAAKLFLPRMAAIVSRGATTHGYLQTLRLSNVTEGADYAFLLDVTKAEAASAPSKFDLSVLGKKKIVGISPSVVMKKKVDAAGGDYEREIVGFIDYLTSEGYGVMLVPHSVRTGSEKTHNNDLPLCRDIYAQILTPQDSVFLNSELSSGELRYLIGVCDYFVASRFHAMVSSLAMSVPTLVIGWSHKYREVLEMFELQEWAFGQDKLSGPYLKQRFEQLIAEERSVRAKLKRHSTHVRTLAERQVSVIVDVIEGRSKA